MRFDFSRIIKKDDFILDIGCWDGKRVVELSRVSRNVYGIDINTDRFRFADKKIRKRLFFGDVTKKIPLKIKFDLIFLSEVLEHVSNDSKALQNIKNSLKRGGKLVLTTPRSVKGLEFWDPAWVRWKLFNGQKHYHYTKKELFQKLKDNGFKIKKYYVAGGFMWLIARWINVFFKYGLRLNKKINISEEKGFCDWIILAEKK